MMSGQNEIKRELADLMASVKPSQRRKAIKKALTYLKQQNAKRIKQQQNPDLTPYKPRQRSNNEGKTTVRYSEKSFIGTIERTRGKNYLVMRLDQDKVFRLSKDKIESRKKYKPKRKKMLVGFTKQLQTRQFGASKGVLNYKSGGRRLARVHHYGSVSPAKIPARRLIGMSELDRTQVLNIMREALEL